MCGKILRVVIVLCLALCGCHSLDRQASSSGVWTPDNGNGTFTNPIFWGDWPDPDVIRVGDDFYFISTSMHYVPGCPIARSKDLVNWEMAGYAVERYEEDPRYDLLGGNRYLKGSWAATIRHHNGLFYVGFCTPQNKNEEGHFSICTARDVKGPWTRTIFPEYLYDPGLLFDDDGKVYVAHGQFTLYVTELNADAMSVKTPARKIIDRTAQEGSHLYKINGKYYILGAAGGSKGWQTCLRSDSVYGPYEAKIVVKDDSTYPPNGLHQGGMVQLKNGDWWFIIMQDRGPIGRVAHLEPVTWIDGWPMLGKDGKGVVTFAKPDVGTTHAICVPATTDEFEDSQLGLQWQWNHNPDPSRWSLKDRRGFLRLYASRASDLLSARNTLTQRVQGPESEGVAKLDVAGLKSGDVAGLGVFEKPFAFVAVQQQGDSRKIVMINAGHTIEEIAAADLKTIWLKAHATDQGFLATFSYSLDGQKFTPIGTPLKMGLGLNWTANRFALFNFSTTEDGVGGHADFEFFRFAGKRPNSDGAK